MSIYHSETQKIYNELRRIKQSLVGGTEFTLADLSITINGKDGLGGLIEEWFGVWAKQKGFNIENPKLQENSQKFPDYYVWDEDKTKHYLEIKTFDNSASANFDIANFQSYCESLAIHPERVNADYLIFAYEVNNGKLEISEIYLKKIWEITCSSERWPLKTQTKRNVIYNIRPSNFRGGRNNRYPLFNSADEFITALFATEEQYLVKESQNKVRYLQNIQKP